jgi:hypothetical protein
VVLYKEPRLQGNVGNWRGCDSHLM